MNPHVIEIYCNSAGIFTEIARQIHCTTYWPRNVEPVITIGPVGVLGG